jgi:NADH dehydrogenase
MNFVIVGGGATGVEMAGALAELAEHALACDFRKINPRDARVILVEGTGGILPGFSEMLRVDSLSQLAALGVEVKLNTFVEDITASGVKTKEEFIEARTVIWCAGVAANSLTSTLGAELDRAGRILVEPDLSIKGFPDAFAVGDCASFLHNGGRPLPGTASVAIQHGRFLAKNIGNIIRGLPRQQFEYADQGSLATIGRSKAIAEFGRIKLSGPIAWLTWCMVHIFFLIGFRNRFSVMTEWVWQYLSYSRGARVVVEKEPEA